MASPSYLSPSQLGTYDWCPAAWKARYVDGITEPPTEAMLFGTAVHKGCEQHYRGEDGIGAFVSNWTYQAGCLTAAGVPVNPRLEMLGVRLVKQVRALGLAGETERRVDVRVAGLPPLHGYVDLWDPEHNTVLDFKTSASAWTARKLERQVWQPAIYSQAVWEETTELPRFAFIVLPKDGSPIQRLDATRSARQLVEAFDRARAIYAKMQALDLPCRCGQHRETPVQASLLAMPATRLGGAGSIA